MVLVLVIKAEIEMSYLDDTSNGQSALIKIPEESFDKLFVYIILLLFF